MNQTNSKILLLLSICLVGLPASSATAQSAAKGSANKSQGSVMKPVAVSNGMATIDASNSKIEFVGTHVGDDPKPRLGGFKKFSGQIKLGSDNSVQSLMLEIDVNSVWTQFDKLTGHLKNSDFFETDTYPTAKFVSTKIETNDKGMKITGNLTLHGTTKEISFPVKGKLDANGVVMVSEFQLDRTMFGMDQMTSGVEKTVSLKFVVGQKTMAKASAPGPGTQSNNQTGDKTTELAEPTLLTLYAPNMT